MCSSIWSCARNGAAGRGCRLLRSGAERSIRHGRAHYNSALVLKGQGKLENLPPPIAAIESSPMPLRRIAIWRLLASLGGYRRPSRVPRLSKFTQRQQRAACPDQFGDRAENMAGSPSVTLSSRAAQAPGDAKAVQFGRGAEGFGHFAEPECYRRALALNSDFAAAKFALCMADCRALRDRGRDRGTSRRLCRTAARARPRPGRFGGRWARASPFISPIKARTTAIFSACMANWSVARWRRDIRLRCWPNRRAGEKNQGRNRHGFLPPCQLETCRSSWLTHLNRDTFELYGTIPHGADDVTDEAAALCEPLLEGKRRSASGATPSWPTRRMS